MHPNFDPPAIVAPQPRCPPSSLGQGRQVHKWLGVAGSRTPWDQGAPCPCPPPHVPQPLSSEPSGQSGCRSQRLSGGRQPPLPQENCLGGQVGRGPPGGVGQVRGLAEVGGLPAERAESGAHCGQVHVGRVGVSAPPGRGVPARGGVRLTTAGLVRAVQAVGAPVADQRRIHAAQHLAGELAPWAEQPGQRWSWGSQEGGTGGRAPSRVWGERSTQLTAPLNPQHPQPQAGVLTPPFTPGTPISSSHSQGCHINWGVHACP